MLKPSEPKPILIEVGPGELIDKITILVIKLERISDLSKLKNVQHELGVLDAARHASIPQMDELVRLETALKKVNEGLWEIEDDIRACEAEKDFGPKFIDLARAVYRQNDTRAQLKKQINLLMGSSIIEEKSYTEFE